MEAKGKWYIKYSGSETEFRIWNIADIHYGNKASAIEQAKRDIKEIEEDPYSFWVGGGDYAEYIGFSDKRFDPDSVHEKITVKDMGQLGRVLIKEVRDLLFPIKHKCLGLLLGNHEKRYALEKDQADLHGWLCTELEVRNFEYSAFFDIVFCLYKSGAKPQLLNEVPDKTKSSYQHSDAYRFFVHHGAGFATTPAGKLNRLINAMDWFDANIYMVGHVHDQTGKRIVQLGADRSCRKLTETQRVGVISGSYLKTYSQGVTTYGEQRMYRPTVLGAAVISIRPFKHEIRGEV